MTVRFGKLTVILLLLTLASPAALSGGIWQQAGDAPVSGGFGQGVVATERFVYVVSQLRVNTEPRFFRFIPGEPDAFWELSTEDLPDGAFRSGTALAWDRDPEGYIYALLGGRTPENGDPNRRLFFRYDLEDDEWEELPPTPAAQGVGNALVYVEFAETEKLYAFLGSKDHETDLEGSVHHTVLAVFDAQSQTWKILNSNPEWKEQGTDEGAALVWDGFDMLYAFQGEVVDLKSRSSFSLARFAVYSISTGKWIQLEDNPERGQDSGCGIAKGASLAYLGEEQSDQSDFIYALGGACVDESPGRNFYRYQISENSWETLTEIPCPVGFYNGDRFFVFEEDLYYWQGSPQTSRFICGGDDVFKLELP